MEYTPTIGLEIHAELKTRTKMFCSSKNNPDEKTPNLNICPICMAHPGTLPVINMTAVKHVLKVGIALGSTLADFTEFDRKNYFYPDIPKNYQISQYEFPLVSRGVLNGIEITRIHLEEDTARSIHTADAEDSLVDFNRAGIPLMELVTEPVIKNAKDAGNFARELQLLLRTLDVSNANMEKGEMRVEANVSVSKTEAFGTKVEVKNINSFKAVEKAIDYEIRRQIKLLEGGGTILQETRGWDENKQETFSQRVKEESADYRYFPDPDLPKLKLSEINELSRDVIKHDMPELPWDKRVRLSEQFGIKHEAVEVYVIDEKLCKLFESVVSEFVGSVDAEQKGLLASNYIINNLVALQGGFDHHVAENVDPSLFASVISRAYTGDISSNAVVEIISKLVDGGVDTKKLEELISERRQKNDEGELMKIVKSVIEEHAQVADEYRAGKEASIRF